MAYKVLDIYKDLPRTNCGACGKGSCFAFASSVFLEGTPLGLCPELDADALALMEAKLREGQARGEGKKPEAHHQALAFLSRQLAAGDLSELARNAGAQYLPGPPEEVRITFLGMSLRVRREDVDSLEGEAPSIWVKILLLIYLTRANGNARVGQWVAFRELPNTVSKAASFEASADRIARAFEGSTARLDEAVRALGGRRAQGGFGTADRAFLFGALPRVEILLLFWDRQEDFPARASILVDRGLLSYLDQEAAVFLAEAFSQRLLGKDAAELAP